MRFLELFLGALPFFFGVAFLAPLAVEVAALMGIQSVAGIGTWSLFLSIFGVWGGIASWTGRWI